jgi:hypothetical protein
MFYATLIGCALQVLTLDECEGGDPRLELQLVR